jgi:peptidoglycan/LPS O-acetylase OafA/YrhL
VALVRFRKRQTEKVGSVFSLFRLDHPRDSIVALEGVRAIACLTVIWYHINLATKGPQSAQRIGVWSPQDVGPLLSELAHVGWCGVTLFFVLSGFLLFLPYARSMLFDTPWPGLRRFYLRRMFRIWPGYFASLALLILLAYPEYLRPERWQEFLLFVTFFMDSSSKTFDHLNGPYWTLAVEWQYYILLPFLAWGMRWIVARGSLSRRLWMLGGCLLAMMAWGLLARVIFWEYSWGGKVSGQPAFEWAQFFLYGRNGKYLEDFAVGMGASVIYVLAQRPELEHKLVALCRKHASS